MIRSLIVLAALCVAALPAVAGEGCDGCPKAKKAQGQAQGEAPCETQCDTECKSQDSGTWTAKLAELEAKAGKGDKQAEAALAAGREACGTECNKEMTAKLAALESKAGAGDEEARKQLHGTMIAMYVASVRAGPLSEQAEFYCKACDHGCEISKQSLAVMMKETGAKDRAELVATVKDWEAKSAKGCQDCSAKIASLRAKLEPAKSGKAPALSVRVGKLAAAAKGGDKAAADRFAKVALAVEVKPENVLATITELESKAANGCKSCVAKLAKVEAVLASAKVEGKDGKDCSDCTKGCSECDEKDCADCDEECEKTCPVESKPVEQ